MSEEPPPPEPQVPPAPSSLPYYTTTSWPPLHYDMFEKVYKLILEKSLFFNTAEGRQQPPYTFKTPEELRKEIDFTLGEKGESQQKLLEYFEKLIAYSPHRSHPFYLAKDGNGLDPYGIAGDFTSNILSTAVLTYLFALVFTLQEYVVQCKLRKLLGYPNPDDGDGVQVPGGGYATCMVIAAAMNYAYPDIRQKGFGGISEPSLGVYASEDCNPFTEKGCIVAGLGSDSFFPVKTDQYGRMNVADLRQQIQRNKSRGIEPLMVIATIGTDPFGAIDPIAEIAQVCYEHNIWMHVDGHHAGPLLLSDEFRNGRLAGIEKSSSFALGGEGMLGTPLCYTTMVTHHTDQFFQTFGVGAEVVFEPTLLYDNRWDNGDHTIQTSRRGDIAKFWLIWKKKGRNGIVQHLKYITDLALQFHAEVKRRSTFYTMQQQVDTNRIVFYNVPFRYRFLPRRMDYASHGMIGLSRKIKYKLLSKGSAYLSLTKVSGYPESFAVSVSNSAATLDDLKYVLDEIEVAGRESSRKNDSKKAKPLTPIVLVTPPQSPTEEETMVEIPLTPEETPSTISFETAEIVEAETEQISETPLNLEHEAAAKFASPPPPRDTYPSFVNSPIPALHENLFKKIFKLFDTKGLYFQDKRAQPILNFLPPDALQREFDLTLNDEPSLASDDDVITALTKMIRYSIHQPHPFYIYQLLSCGLDPSTIMADFMLTVMTSNLLTYEDAPFYTLMEEEVLRASRKRLGLPEDGDGMLTPGGTPANIVAMVVARLDLFPETKQKGLEGWREMKLTAYISKNAHYCFQKGALLQGIGLDNVVQVEPDGDGRMDVNELRKAVAQTKAEGGTPFFVVATAGTTVLGVYDNVKEINKVCKENNMWLHADGSVGGTTMFSDTQLRTRLSNHHVVDSMNFNPHKWLGSSQECTILVFRKNGVVKKTLGVGTESLARFQNRKKGLFDWFGGGSKKYKNNTPPPHHHDEPNRQYDSTSAFGDLAARGGVGWERRANILKFWFMWKAKGREGLEKHIDYTFTNKDFVVQELKRPERQKMYRLVKQDYECAGVCFYYLPLAIRDMDQNSEEYQEALESVPLPLQARLVREGVTIPPVFRDNGSPLFTKFTMLSSGMNKDDLKYLLDAIDYHGRDLPVQ